MRLTKPGDAAALAMWIAPQAAALCASAFRLPLSAGFADPAESAALSVMLATQVIAAAALFPAVVADVRRLAMAIAVAWAFAGLACFLSAAATEPALLAMGHVALWLGALWAWAAPLARGRWTGLGVAVAMLLTVGGAMAGYLHAEYRPLAQGTVSGRWWEWSPLLTTLSQAGEGAILWPGWAATAAVLAGGLAFHAAIRSRQRAAV